MSLEVIEQDAACGTCCYWSQLGDGIGQCRRYAPRPRITTGNDQVTWPITEEYEFCGEWEDGQQFCDCDDDETCAVCGDDDTDDRFDAIIAELTAPPARRRWWRRKAD